MPREKETKRLSAPPMMNVTSMDIHTSPSAPELVHSNGEINGCNTDNNGVSEELEPLELVIIDDVFDFNVDTIHEMIFGDNPFYKHFQETKKSSKLVISDWTDSEEDDVKTRSLSYNVAINNSLGPKSASSTEKQFLRTLTPGRCYVVDAHCHTRGVPYGDYFYLLNRFSMTRASANTTRLVISSRIVYVKKCWGIIKKFIETNVKSGVRESYILLAQLLREEMESAHAQNQTVIENNKNLINNKRRNSSKTSSRTSSTETSTPNDTPRISPHKHTTRPTARRCSKLIASERSHIEDTQDNENADKMAKCVLILVVFLIAIHATLFYKLRVVEEQANILTQSNDNIRYFRPHVAPSAWDINEQVKEHKMQHSELDTWQHVLTASAELMANVQESLVQLQADIDNKVRHRNTIP